ncbi:TetR/AcrR family transcriptional regulator C-terminal domain-containing protein [Kineococcus sp. SYSU DK004]|uniref:TetR/AcrR family transcriptional regulator C-terminal domain-containing protein n=1 Tax=Kineococcus sp. SYSU DK004 TaxID=3383125 RepID=UPI003D7EB397
MSAPTTRGTLNRQRVLATALAVADADGLTAVTMRRLARDLGVEAMSIYHHVRGKDALLDGLVETVLDEAAAELTRAGDAPRQWRAALRHRCLAARTVMLRHPWAPALLTSRPAVPPSAFAWFEAVLATLVEGGFSYALAHRALHALGSTALGFTQELFTPAPPASAATGPADASADALSALSRMADVLPHTAAMVAAEVNAHDGDVLGWCDSQAEFEFTLDLLLDGLERAR